MRKTLKMFTETISGHPPLALKLVSPQWDNMFISHVIRLATLNYLDTSADMESKVTRIVKHMISNKVQWLWNVSFTIPINVNSPLELSPSTLRDPDTKPRKLEMVFGEKSYWQSSGKEKPKVKTIWLSRMCDSVGKMYLFLISVFTHTNVRIIP